MERANFLNALKAVMPGVEKQEILTGMDSVVFEKDWLRSFNEEISVAYPLDTNLICAVRAEELYRIVNKMSDDEIQVSLEEDKLIVKDYRTTLKMATLDDPSQILERMKSLGLDKIQPSPLPDNFMNGLEYCIFSAGKDLGLEMMAGIAVEGNQMISTDNFRVGFYQLSKDMKTSFILSTSSAESIIKLGEKFTEVSITSSWIHLITDKDVIVSSRAIVGEYPWNKLGNLLSDYFDGKEELYSFPKELRSSIDRAEILASSEKSDFLDYVTLSCKKNVLRVEGRKSVGEILDKIPWKESQMPEGIKLLVSPPFLKKILPVTSDFSLSKNKRAVLFQIGDFKHLMVVLVE